MRRDGARRGFTLLELLVVLVILAAVTAVAVPSLAPGAGPRSPLDQAAERAAGLLREARAFAVREGVPAAVRVSADGRVIAGPQDTLRLEPDVRVEPAGASVVIFYPTGLATGARWLLRAGEGGAVRIEVSPLLGEVEIGRANEAN